ncbi:MAG: hypothetical protein V4858_29470 [Pseudomonadota bacterium]
MKRINVLAGGHGTGWPNTRLRGSTWALGLSWCGIFLMGYALASSAQVTAAVVLLSIVAACGLVAWLGGEFAQSLGAGARVLGQRQVPTRLWRQWLLAGLKRTLLHSGAFALAAGTFAMLVYSPWHGLAAAAIVFLVMSLSVLWGLARQGLAPRVWSWVAPVLILLPLVGAGWGGGVAHTLRGIDHLPWIVLFCSVASGSILALVLPRRWLEQAPQVRARSFVDAVDIWKDMKGRVLRYTPLTAWAEGANPASDAPKRSVYVVMFWPVYWLINPTMLMPWGTGIPAWQVWLLGLIALLTSTLLVCKDLHWRRMLAPAGMRRGGLGWHIAVSTATVNFIGLLIAIAVGTVAVRVFAPSISLDSVATYLAGFCLAPVQLVFAISVGTLIRGTGYTRWWLWGLVTVWVLAGIAVLGLGSVFGVVSLRSEWFVADSPYVLSLLVLSAMALWLANRLWTVDKLLRCAPK